MSNSLLRLCFLRLALIAAALSISSTLAFGQAETILHDFIALPHGSIPQAALVADAAGNLYGTATDGGIYGSGAVFKLSPSSNGKWTQTLLYSFTGQADGAYPISKLVFDAAGNLYGTASESGAYCIGVYCGTGGTVFMLSPNSNGTWTESTLHSFGALGDGQGPIAGLTIDKAGNLYGTTQYGSTDSYGTVFEMSLSQGTWTESVLYTFTDENDGGYPLAGLTLDNNGNLYGTGSIGGDITCNNYEYQPWGCGVVFKLAHNPDGSWTESVLHSFDQFDGAFPQTGVIFDAGGNLEGTTLSGPGFNCTTGCGTVFQLTPGSTGWTFKSVYTFEGGPDGAFPKGDLVLGADGNFYGTTSSGGNTTNCSYGCGTVFQLTPTSTSVWKEKIIHNFSGTSTAPFGVDGEAPVAGVIFDQADNLYGTASNGGPATAIAQCNGIGRCGGTIFKMSKGSSGQWTTSLLYTFTASGDGLTPAGALIADAAGNLYGATQSGGTHGYGAVYEMTPQSSGGYKERIIYSFLGGSDGYYPTTGLVLDPAGNLYGATYAGGVNSQCSFTEGCGTVYRLSPAAGGKWTETILHAFTDTDGLGAMGPLNIDSAGNLYGETFGNTQNTNGGAGTIFEVSPSGSSWTLTTLFAFAGTGYGYPNPDMIMDSSGNLFGTVQGGQKGVGVVFELAHGSSGWTYSVLHSFAGGADGAYPYGLAIDKAGILFGVTYDGRNTSCQQGCGTAFQIVQSGGTWQKRTIYSFAGGTDASNPLGNLTLDSSGNLYGTSLGAGSGTSCSSGTSCGAIYKLSQSAGLWSESVVYSFGLVPYDAARYFSTLLWSPSNILYGTGEGGDDFNGVAYQVDLNQSPQHSAPPPARVRPPEPPLRSSSNMPTPPAQAGKGGN